MLLDYPIDSFVWRALAIFLLIGAVLGVALALLLIFNPQLLARVNHLANRWISTRGISRLLDRSISIEHWFYQHHRVVGIFAVLGAIWMLSYFGLWFDKAATLQGLSNKVPVKLPDGLLDALVLSALIGATVALLVGLFLWLRPSLLRGFEAQSNQWVSSRKATKILDIPRDQVDIFVTQHARKIGWLLLLASIYLLFAMLRLLA